MRERSEEVLVEGVRFQVMRREGTRLLIQPLSDAGQSLNVSRWIGEELAVKVTPAVPVFSADEIRQLASVLRDVFYEEADPQRHALAGRA